MEDWRRLWWWLGYVARMITSGVFRGWDLGRDLDEEEVCFFLAEELAGSCSDVRFAPSGRAGQVGVVICPPSSRRRPRVKTDAIRPGRKRTTTTQCTRDRP